MATNQNPDHSDQLLDIPLDDFTNLSLSSVHQSGDQVEKLESKITEFASAKKSHANKALEELRKQTIEAFQELELMEGVDQENGMVHDFVKQLQEVAGSQDMESIAESMMHQLMSKETLHEPMKEIGEKYPKWLEENKVNLKQEEYDRYFDQYKLILQLNDVYEYDPGNFQKIVGIIHEMQECGQPPINIVKEFAPDLDLANLGELL